MLDDLIPRQTEGRPTFPTSIHLDIQKSQDAVERESPHTNLKVLDLAIPRASHSLMSPLTTS